MRSVSLLVISITACGVDHSSSGPVTITTTTAPALAAFRDGADGPWQTLPAKTPSTFQHDAQGPYMIAIVCDDGVGDVTTYQFARTQEDDRAIEAPCDPATGTGTASGHMVQAGSVAVGYSSAESTTANWDFTANPGTGTFDLVATSSDRILVHRALAVSGDTMVMPAIDLTQGSALVVAAPTVTNALASETLHTYVFLDTKSTFLNLYGGTPATTKIAPDDVLVADDDQSIGVSADTATGGRTVHRDHYHAGQSTSFTLPDPIGAVQFPVANGQLAATWSTLPSHDSLDAWVYWESADFSKFFYHDVEISAAFVDATGIASAPFDVTMPGYKPEWKLDATKEYNVGLDALAHDGNDTAISAATLDVNAPATRSQPATRTRWQLTRGRL